jgi:hypothetical protein
LLKPFADPEENFLDEVGGVIGIARKPIGKVIDLPSVNTRYFFPGQWCKFSH